MNKLLNRFLILCLLGTAPVFAEEEHEEEEGGPEPGEGQQGQGLRVGHKG